MRVSLIVSLIISLLAIIFALLNNQDVLVNFVFFETFGPLALVLMVTFLLGICAGVLFMLPGRIKKGKEAKTLRKQMQTQPTSEDKPPAPPPPDAPRERPPHA